MTREETLAWAKSLKPGDVVIWSDFGQYRTLTVQKVTTTGIVKTNGDMSFAQTSRRDDLSGCGKTSGIIIPATAELLTEVEKEQKERENLNRIRRTIRAARTRMRLIYDISYEFAVDFLELCEKHGIKA